MAGTPRHKLFVTCAGESVSFLAEELASLGLGSKFTASFRGVTVDELPQGLSVMEAIFRINYHSHLAMRVLLPLRKFELRKKEDLYENMREIDWRPFIPSGCTFAVSAKVNDPHFSHTLYAAQVCKDAIIDQYRDRNSDRPNVETENPDVKIQVFAHEGQATINMDTSILPLHIRGYRRQSG